MATPKQNSLQLTGDTLSKLFAEKQKMQDPSWVLDNSQIQSTGGTQTVSQKRNEYLANIDWKKRTPLQNFLEFGSKGFAGSGEEVGREEQKKAIERMRQEAIASGGAKTRIEEPPATKVSESKKQEPQKVYRVMYAGKNAASSEVFNTKDEADAALKKAGGKGAIAGINIQQKTKDGEILPTDETESRKQKYLDQLSATKQKSAEEKQKADKYAQALKEARSPEYKKALQERVAAANEAKRLEDMAAGESFADWSSKVKARRDTGVSAYDEYNYQKGLIRKAEQAARRSGNFAEAFNIAQKRKQFEKGIPEEMGARMKFFQERSGKEREAQIKQLRDQDDSRKLYASNPNAISYAAPKKPISLWNANNSLSLE